MTGRTIPLVRTSALIPFVWFLERIGAPLERRRAETMLPNDVLSEPESLIPLNKGLLFLERNARAEGLQNLGILTGRQTHFAQLGAFGHYILRSVTLYDALNNISQLFHLYNSAHKIWLDSWGEEVRICHAYTSDVGIGREYGDEFTLMLLIDCIRLAAGPRWSPAEIHVEPGLWNLIGKQADAFGGISIRKQAVSAIVLARELLSVPFESARLARQSSQAREYEALVASAPAFDFPDSIGQLIHTYLRSGQYQMERIASAAGVSPRTLQRRLSEKGVEYSRLVDGARFDMAMHLLNERTNKLIDIAYDLGYSDAASFTRAFRRWTGIAPSEFRQQATGRVL